MRFVARWGTRLADVVSETPTGDVVLDLRHFDKVVPTVPTAAFPYPASAIQNAS